MLEQAQIGAQILDFLRDHMDDAGFVLHAPGDRDEPRADDLGRCRSNSFGQTTILAIPVSSSIVMKMTPLAEPGRWRTSTRPATLTRAPCAAPPSPAAREGWGGGRRRAPHKA